MSQIISPADVDFEAYMAETEPQAKVLAAEAWRDELARAVEHGEQITGAKLPWAKTHDLLRFRAGEGGQVEVDPRQRLKPKDPAEVEPERAGRIHLERGW